ncbi:MAG: hypothetical protein ACI8QC_002876 [Planctomycetota bacterium]|jgi:hypothetical protein
MLTTLRASACVAILFASPSFGQTTVQPQSLPSQVRNAGIYHVASGTWTRTSGAIAALGPDVIYKNDAPSGYFSTLNNAVATGDWSILDSGRIPTAGGSIAGVTHTDYVVNALELSYCSDVTGPNVGITFNLYDSYKPCDIIATSPTAPFSLAGSLSAAGLPGGASGVASCWVVTLDVSGGGEFCLEGDGGSAFPGVDGDIERDSFGIEWIFNDVWGTATGPILAGDPNWTLGVAGAHLGGGGGTYYHPMTTCADTGLDTPDYFATEGLHAPIYDGCHFFGGYKNTNGCGSASNTPLAAFHTVVYADLGVAATCDSGLTFCEPAGTNSSGSSVELFGVASGSAGSGWHLDAHGGPPNQAGYFLVSAGNNGSVSVGQGTLCLDSPAGRYNPVFGGAGNSLGVFNGAGDLLNAVGTGGASGNGFDIPANLPSPIGGAILPGSTWHFQVWYRDFNPGSTSNFSNGQTIQF